MNHTKVLLPPSKIGIVGGGQLGRMIAVEAKRMGYHVTVLDPTPNCPAAQVADEQITAAFSDSVQIRRLAETTEVLTYEFEHINADALCMLENENHTIIPSGHVLHKIQNKYLQKNLLKNAGLPVPDFWKVDSVQEVIDVVNDKGLPLVLKSCYGGYDGKGNVVIRKKEEIEPAIHSVGGKHYYVEQFVDFQKELSIMVCANGNGEIVYYPVVENIHEESILRLTKVPADISDEAFKQVVEIAREVVKLLGDCGVFCIELFIEGNGRLTINEIAPRPHNSGHYTIEACVTSQYEQLVRILTGMPLGSTELISPCAMANILGDHETTESDYYVDGLDYALSVNNVYFHLYGKQKTSKLRKLGHLTVLSDCVENAQRILADAMSRISVIRK